MKIRLLIRITLLALVTGCHTPQVVGNKNPGYTKSPSKGLKLYKR